jgi:hypothetical protein
MLGEQTVSYSANSGIDAAAITALRQAGAI